MGINKNRVQWIDVARGIAILLVVLGHCIGDLENPCNKFILAFHMPLFFFLSGLCAKRTHEKFLIYFKKKAKSLLIPQITLGVLNCIYGVTFGGIGGGYSSLLNNFLGWFLLVLFYVTIIFYVINIIEINKKLKYILVFIIDIFAILVLNIFNVKTKLHFEIIPMALLFYLMGYFIKTELFNNKLVEKFKLNGYWVFIIPILIITSYWNAPVAMYKNGYGNLLLFILGAILGVVLTCKLAQSIDDNKLLAWMGQNSIIVYVVHFKLINLLHYIGKIAFPQLSKINYQYPAYWHYFVICVIILIPITYICQRYFYFIFGKHNNFNKALPNLKND